LTGTLEALQERSEAAPGETRALLGPVAWDVAWVAKYVNAGGDGLRSSAQGKTKATEPKGSGKNEKLALELEVSVRLVVRLVARLSVRRLV
jgi:hypothetical protein